MFLSSLFYLLLTYFTPLSLFLPPIKLCRVEFCVNLVWELQVGKIRLISEYVFKEKYYISYFKYYIFQQPFWKWHIIRDRRFILSVIQNALKERKAFWIGILTAVFYLAVFMILGGRGGRIHILFGRLIWNTSPGDMLTGILLGVEAGIPKGVKEAFSATSTAHVIAISGFNKTQTT